MEELTDDEAYECPCAPTAYGVRRARGHAACDLNHPLRPSPASPLRSGLLPDVAEDTPVPSLAVHGPCAGPRAAANLKVPYGTFGNI